MQRQRVNMKLLVERTTAYTMVGWTELGREWGPCLIGCALSSLISLFPLLLE